MRPTFPHRSRKSAFRPKSRRPSGRRLIPDPSGHDAAVLAGELGESRDGSRRREAETALERKAQRAASGSEFRLPAAEVAETEGQMAVRVLLRGEPGGVAVGCEDLDDGFEVDGLVLAVDGGALGAAILEEFLALGGGDQLIGARSERDRSSTGRDSGFALARAVRLQGS